MSDEMKRDIERLRTDMADMRGTTRRILATLVRLEVKVDDIADRMATELATKDILHVIKTRLARVETRKS